MIPTTPFEHEVLRRVQAGELCATVLAHGDLCGREIHKGHGVGLCEWHSEELLHLPHRGEGESAELLESEGKNCIRCKRRPRAFRATKLCGNCHKVTMRQRRRDMEIVTGYIVEV